MDKISATSASATSVAWWEKIQAQLMERKPTATQQAGMDPAAATGASAQFSGAANVYRELSQLQASDPVEFKQVMTDVAARMTDVANGLAAGPERTRWAELASRFDKAAQTGEASAIMPGGSTSNPVGTYSSMTVAPPANGTPTQSPKGRGDAAPSRSASSAASTQAVSEFSSATIQLFPPKDLNKDGTVTAPEAVQWQLRHPAAWMSEWPVEEKQPPNNIDVGA